MRSILRQIVAVLALVGITTSMVPATFAVTYTAQAAADKLAASSFIVDQSATPAAYRLADNLLRQEAVGTAANVLGILTVPLSQYVCQNKFSDVSASDGWVCRAAELAANAGLTNAANAKFNPKVNLKRGEALIFALRAAGLVPSEGLTQAALVNLGVDNGLITSSAGFNYDATATRGEFFQYVVRALDAAETPELCEILGICPNPNPTPISGAVSVSISSTNPGAATLLSDDTTGVMQNAAPVIKLNFRNNNSTPVAVNTLRLTRGGITVDADVNNLYLYDGVNKIAEMSSSANKIFSFNNSAGLFTIPANSNKEVWVGVNMTTGISGNKTISFSVAASSDVVLSNSSTAGGAYPVNGNTFTVAAVTDLGYVNLTNTTTFPATIDPSDVSKELWRFTATANGQKMAVKRIVLTMVGTINPADISDLTLRVNGVQVGQTAQIGSDSKVVFDLSSAPYEILSGQNKVFVLEGKVIKGTGRAFKFTVRSTADFVVIDKNYNVETTPLSGGSALTVVDPDSSGDGTNINNGTLTVSRSLNSPTGNVVTGGIDVVLARFDYKASGEDVKVQYVRVGTNNSQGVTMNDGKLYFNGAQVGTTDDSVADATANVFSLGNTVIIPAGTTGVFEYRANIEQDDGTDLTAEGTIVTSLTAGTTDATGQTSLTNIATSAATGNTLTIKSGTLSAAINSAFASRTSTNPTGVKGAVAVKVGSFVIAGGSGEATRITQIVVGDDGGDATEDFGDNFQNLVMKNSNGVSISNSTNSTLSGTAGADFTFNISPTIEIPAGGQYVVDLYADVLTGAAGYTTAAPGLEFVSVSAAGVITGSDSSYSTVFDLQNAYVATSGTLTPTLDSDTPVAAQYVMGATDQTVAKFKLAASSSETINVTKVIIGMDDGDATDNEAAVRGDFTNYRIYNGATLVGSASSATADANTTEDIDGLITFDNLTLSVPANGSVVLTLKADVSTYPNATSADAVVFSIPLDGSSELPTFITAQGAGSGADVSTDAASDQDANAATVYRTKLTVAYASDSPSGSSSGATGQVVAKYVVSNSANAGNYDATLNLFGQTISSTIALTAETTRDVKIYKDSITSGNLLATVTYDTSDVSSALCTPSATLSCIDSGAGGDTTEDRFGATNADTTNGLTAARFVDVTIAAGSSKTIIVTADTLDAASAKNFSVQPISGGAATGVSWSDGITSAILTIDSLPLVPVKTLTY